MPYDANITGTTELADAIKEMYDEMFIISALGGRTTGVESLATRRSRFKAKNIDIPVFSKLTVQTSALTEDDEATSEAMSDSLVTLTPAEYGNVVTMTNLADLQSGGVDSRAAVELVGENARESAEKLMITAGEASTNEIIVGQTAESSVTSSDILSKTYVNRAYNKLKRSGIPRIDGSYWCIAHDDVLHDLREGTAAGTWVDVNKYDNSMQVRENEVGMYGGFRFISHPLVSVNANAGSGNVDTYHSLFFGYNAFGHAISQDVSMGIRGPFDKLGRFVHIGWYGVFVYGIVDSNALWAVTSASSIGANS